MNRAFLFFLSIFILSCSSAPKSYVVLSPKYRSVNIQSVALIGFTDNPQVAGSGEAVAGIFEKYLLLGSYNVVERRQMNEILREQALQITGVIDPSTRKKIGHLLGVDALVLGNVNIYKDSSVQTVLVEEPQQFLSPTYDQIETTHRSGAISEKITHNYISGYHTITSSKAVVRDKLMSGHISFSVRMVNVESGALLWSTTGSADGFLIDEAIEKASFDIMQTVEKEIQKKYED